MRANDVEKRRSRAALTSKLGGGSSRKANYASPEAGNSSAEATQEGEASHRKDKFSAPNDLASNEKPPNNPLTARGHVPNEETAKVLREAREGKNLLHYESLEEMFKDLGI